jgi:hypothetical protein
MYAEANAQSSCSVISSKNSHNIQFNVPMLRDTSQPLHLRTSGII